VEEDGRQLAGGWHWELVRGVAACSACTRGPIRNQCTAFFRARSSQPLSIFSQRTRTHDRAWLAMDITADLRPLWHWNVKQAFVYVTAEVGPTPADSDDSSAAAPGAAETKNPATPAPATATQAILWSRIVRSKADAHIVRTGLRAEYPYVLSGRGHGLRGVPLNLTVGWALTPRVGALRSGSGGSGGVVELPVDYVDPPGGAGDWD
jgi:hypothetical protein